jgi:hypothetical protein
VSSLADGAVCIFFSFLTDGVVRFYCSLIYLRMVSSIFYCSLIYLRGKEYADAVHKQINSKTDDTIRK